MSKDMQGVNMNQVQATPTGLGRDSAAAAAPTGLDRDSAAAATPTGLDRDSAAAAAPIEPGPELDALEHRAWRAFLSRHARIVRILEADLMARNDLPLAEFDVLFQLAVSEGHRLRMNELANRVLLSRAGITRLVDRLVADGLVARAKCDVDARGSYAVLTDRGRARLDEARPGHLTAVKRHFVDSFSRAELETLAELMERTVPAD